MFYLNVIDLHIFSGYLVSLLKLSAELSSLLISKSSSESVFLLFLFLKFSFSDKLSLHLIFSLSVCSATIWSFSGVTVGIQDLPVFLLIIVSLLSGAFG